MHSLKIKGAGLVKRRGGACDVKRCGSRRGRGRGQRGRGRRRRSRSGRGRGRGGTRNESQDDICTSGMKRQEPLPSHQYDDTDNEDINGNLKRFKGTLTNYENEELIVQTQKMLEVHEDVDDNTKVSKTSRHFEESLNRIPDINGENNADAVGNRIGASFLIENQSKISETNRLPRGENQRRSMGCDLGEKAKRNFRNNLSNQMLCEEESRPQNRHFGVELTSGDKCTDKLNNCVNRVPCSANTVPELGTCKLESEPEPSEITNVLSSPKPINDDLEEGEIVDSDEEMSAVIDTSEGNNVTKNTSSTVKDESCSVEIHKLPSFFTVNENEVSDEEVETPVKEKVLEKPVVQAAGALGSLISNYGTDSDSEGEIKDEPSTSRQQGQPSTNRNDAIRRLKKPAPDMFPISRRRLTLLEKLLRNEIRRERNIILQCVHHIVKNDFFNVETASDR